MMYVFEYFIYHLKPYGIASSIVLPPGKKEQQHPVSSAMLNTKPSTPSVSVLGHTTAYVSTVKRVNGDILFDTQSLNKNMSPKKKALLKGKTKSVHGKMKYIDKLLRNNKVEDGFNKKDSPSQMKEILAQS